VPAGRYFFTILDGKLIVDTEGEYCASWADMREQAIKTAGGCLRDMAAKYPSDLEWQLVVTNEGNETVLRLRFALSETSPATARPEPVGSEK
jgi:hypothetical protein